ncbi:AhpA/YtjB family protein [Colwellia sp. 20A7]|uniref:AhpA/YtjB family protein n=1 Tax=Colwellia sp. 20A7 TaxID=2689569 RepID=UPI001EF379AE|nr:AhpA/YtjB family protein [Colwellia sp. 20A7]
MMNKLEQPLYPKLSSIYNKILQLVSAILLIVMLLVFLVDNTEKNNQVVEQHFEQVADKLLEQAIAGISVILMDNTSSISKKERNAQLQAYLNNLADADYIKHVHLYDTTGLLMLKSESSGEISSTIKYLYGIDEVMPSLDKSKQYVPVIKEIRSTNIKGYLRLTIEKYYLTSALIRNNYESHTSFRLLLLAAGVIGFLLTRGLNRFSRQGYRAPKSY